jgi:lipid-A-disaccharide synthase-like uncharacterized protein
VAVRGRASPVLLALLALGLAAAPLHAAASPAAAGDSAQEVRIKVKPRDASSVHLGREADGSLRYRVRTLDDRELVLAPDQYADLLFHDQTDRPRLYRLFNIYTPIGFLWVALGFLGQALFTGRMVVQWVASERSRRSVVPVAFWWLSLGGASMLMVYFVWRTDIVGILGQATGWVVYSRNLYLIYRHGSAEADTLSGAGLRP